MADLSHSYAVLGLKTGASREEVKRAYRRLAKAWHPDRFPHDPERQRQAHQRLQEINAAYSELQVAALPAQDHGVAAEPTRDAAPPGEPAGGKTSAKIPRAHPLRPVSTAFPWGLALFATACLLLVFLQWHSPQQPRSTRVRQMAAAERRDSIPRTKSLLKKPEKAPTLAEPVPSPKAASGHASETGAETGLGIPLPRPAGPRYFTLGSGEAEVLAAQGRPDSVAGPAWKYGHSLIIFRDARVISYLNLSRNLQVRLAPKTPLPAAPRGYFDHIW